jgi:hypothetical protein
MSFSNDNDQPQVKVFSKLYVSKKDQGQNEPKLGFMTPYEENAAGRNRIETANKWARGYPTYVDGKPVYKTEIDHEIIQNEALNGFKFGEEIRRTYWGGGNVVWRVKDPRGFELEISSSNLAKILSFSNIKNGEILEKCFWGRVGPENVLVPEGCPEFSNLILNAELLAKRKTAEIAGLVKSVGDVKIGDFVKLHNNESGVYLGRWWVAGVKAYENLYPKNVEVFQRHLILCNSNIYVVYGVADFKPVSIDSTHQNDFVGKSEDEVQKILNRLVNFMASFGNAKEYNIIFINKKKFNFYDLVFSKQIIVNEFIIEKFKNFKDVNVEKSYTTAEKKLYVNIPDTFTKALTDFKLKSIGADKFYENLEGFNENVSTYSGGRNFYTRFCLLKSHDGQYFTPKDILKFSPDSTREILTHVARAKSYLNQKANTIAFGQMNAGYSVNVDKASLVVDISKDFKEAIQKELPHLMKDTFTGADLDEIEKAIKEKVLAYRNSKDFKCEINALAFNNFSIDNVFSTDGTSIIDFGYLENFKYAEFNCLKAKKATYVMFDNIHQMFVFRDNADVILNAVDADTKKGYQFYKDFGYNGANTMFKKPVFSDIYRPNIYSNSRNEFESLENKFNGKINVGTIWFETQNEADIFLEQLIKFIDSKIKNINLVGVTLKDDKLFDCIHYI